MSAGCSVAGPEAGGESTEGTQSAISTNEPAIGSTGEYLWANCGTSGQINLLAKYKGKDKDGKAVHEVTGFRGWVSNAPEGNGPVYYAGIPEIAGKPAQWFSLDIKRDTQAEGDDAYFSVIPTQGSTMDLNESQASSSFPFGIRDGVNVNVVKAQFASARLPHPPQSGRALDTYITFNYAFKGTAGSIVAKGCKYNEDNSVLLGSLFPTPATSK